MNFDLGAELQNIWLFFKCIFYVGLYTGAILVLAVAVGRSLREARIEIERRKR